MNAKNEIDHTAERLRDALGAAADLMLKGRDAADPPITAPATPGAPSRRRPGSAWLAPLAAGAAVVAVVLGSLLVASSIGGPNRSAPAGGGTAAQPEFYLTLDSTTHGRPLEVHRTSDGAVTASERFPGVLLQEGYLTADISDRAFYVASFPACTRPTPVTRFYRITISDSGRITGIHAVGSPVSGAVGSLAVSPDGSRMAYTIQPDLLCDYSSSGQGSVAAIHVMDLSTGVIRTWRNTVTAPEPQRVTRLINGLSWTPDGRTVVAMARWGSNPEYLSEISVLGLDATGAGGSLQASSRVLISQDQTCVSCVQEAVAGTDGSLTVVMLREDGRYARQMVARIWPGTGRPPAVLYSGLGPPAAVASFAGVFADPSGKWVITWPPAYGSNWYHLHAGWIRNGKLVSLPGTTLTYPDAIAW